LTGTGEGATGNQPYENYDLKAEAEAARDPCVRFAFEHPELLRAFEVADKKAIAAKRASRRIGFLSVFLVLIALLIASAAPLLKGLDHDQHVLLGYVSAGLGIIGAILGLSGLRKTASRRKWLHYRLQTESMRLFHFHMMASRLPEIAMADQSGRDSYLESRRKAFDRLTAKVLDKADEELSRIRSQHDLSDFDVGVEEAAVTGNENPQAIKAALDAWRRLRLDWQLGYCEAKLSHRSSAGSLSALQTEHLFSWVAWIAIAIVIGLHLTQFAAGPLHLPLALMEVMVIWTALIALAARALEDGLQPQRDVERYEQYRANILVARERLNGASDFVTQLEVIRSFERISLEEMRVFLRTHAKSKFLL